MGWDAYAKPKPSGEKQLKDFKAIKKSVLKHAPYYDGGLDSYYLDLSDTAQALHEMTGWSVYDEYGWTPDRVKGAWEHAKLFGTPPREDGFDTTDACAYWSAWFFLKACAENNLGIEFSY